MKIFKNLILFVFLGAATLPSISQRIPQPPAPPPPMARKAEPKNGPEKTDQQIAAEVIELVKKPIAWKSRNFTGFDISVELPRETIKQTEHFFEQGLGRMRVEMHLSVGEGSVYVVGKYELPYAVRDEKVLRELYASLATGMAEGGQQFQHIRDFQIDGGLGVEMRSLPDDLSYQPARSHAFMIGRSVYIMVAMPAENELQDTPPDNQLNASRTAEFDRFFSSVTVNTQPAKPPSVDPPMFRSSWEGGVFTSTHFRFAFEPPTGWIKMSDSDVNDLQNWGRRVIKEESGRSLPTATNRRNLATFVSGPLGEDRLAMVSINIGLPYSTFDDVRSLGKETERLLAGMSNYVIVKRPFDTKLGGSAAIRMENTLAVAGVKQFQFIYYFPRISHVLAITATCIDKADCDRALASLELVKFDDK